MVAKKETKQANGDLLAACKALVAQFEIFKDYLPPSTWLAAAAAKVAIRKAEAGFAPQNEDDWNYRQTHTARNGY